jgi:cyclophilin family peptidyl-prolyl cis-trans isomerase/HEAT repeat protein
MPTENFRKTLCAGLLVVVSITTAAAQKAPRASNSRAISTDTLLRILRHEDERRWDDNLAVLLADKDARVRKRAALAIGRIGDERAVPALIDVLKADADLDVRQMAAFALGEIESPAGADALIAVLDDPREPADVRARSVEALGKIGAVLLSNSAAPGTQGAQPKAEAKPLAKIRLAILDALKFEAGRRSMPDRLTILLGLTAALRARPEGAGPVITRFLGYSDPRIVADALNTMARLRLKDGSEQVRQLLGNGDAIVRANAARVIGAAEDKGAFDALLDRALHDYDLRVRVSAIRALGGLKDARAAEPLLNMAARLLPETPAARNELPLARQNELLEIAATLGRVVQGSYDKKAANWLKALRDALNVTAPEPEIAFAKVAPRDYTFLTNAESVRPRVNNKVFPISDSVERTDRPILVSSNWRQSAAVADGLAEIAKLEVKPDLIPDASLRDIARDQLIPALLCQTRPLLSGRQWSGGWARPKGDCLVANVLAVPQMLQALAALKPRDLATFLKKYLGERDVIIRATAAELLGEQPPDESNARALIDALPVALRDRDLNDAALSILDALAKQKNPAANDAIKTALNSSDHLIRRRAVALLKANGAGDFSSRIGTVKTRNTEADYRRAIARIGRRVTATVVTSKGAFTIEFLPEEAPLTVDSFVQLARKGYFNRQTVPRVVPNFVIQTGDPRGDQNGGPGYQIRCEINEAPYGRAAVGMALSGKDTGGSQWFVTHSPQPHLDGGYTVFGRVIRGMEVVDRIVRGDAIRRVIVNDR